MLTKTKFNCLELPSSDRELQGRKAKATRPTKSPACARTLLSVKAGKDCGATGDRAALAAQLLRARLLEAGEDISLFALAAGFAFAFDFALAGSLLTTFDFALGAVFAFAPATSFGVKGLARDQKMQNSMKQAIRCSETNPPCPGFKSERIGGPKVSQERTKDLTNRHAR